MLKDNSVKSLLFFSRTGCLLPLLIIFNLFFGWIFFPPVYWVSIEVILALLFIINSFIVMKKVFIGSRKQKNVIDVQGEVLKDNSQTDPLHKKELTNP